MEERLERKVEVMDKGMFGGDTLALGQYLGIFGSRSPIEPEKGLMLAVLKDAIACFQKYVHARHQKGNNLFREAEEWISEMDSDRLFSFGNICEILDLNPDYFRQRLINWKEEQTNGNKPYIQASRLEDASLLPESGKNIEGMLTSMQTEVLRGAAISLCNPTINGNNIRKQISSDYGMSAIDVDYNLRKAYARLKVRDLPSALYIAFRKGILNLNDIPSENLKSIVKGLEKLTPKEAGVLKAYKELALEYGRVREQSASKFLNISHDALRTRKTGIYEKFGVNNTAYFGIVLYVDEKRQSGT